MTHPYLQPADIAPQQPVGVSENEGKHESGMDA
jgi:hypothetical protein